MTRMIAALAAAVFLTALVGPALADDKAALRAAVERYVRHPATQSVLDSILSLDTTRAHVVNRMQAHGTTLGSDQIETLTLIIQQELERVRPQMERLMITSANETYSLDEIQALNAFCDTEVGARAMSKAGRFMQIFNAGASPMFKRLLVRLGTRIEAELLE